MGRRKEISVEQWPDFDVLAVKSGCITVKQQTIWRNRYQENDVLGENYQLEIATFYTRNEVSRFNFCLASIPNNPHDYFSLQKKKKKEYKMHCETHTAIYSEISLKRDETISKDAHLFGSLQDSFK